MTDSLFTVAFVQNFPEELRRMEKTVFWIEGDGIGPDVWAAGRPVLDAAVAKAYGADRKLVWKELLAGE